MTAAVVSLDWDTESDDRYWLRPTLAATSRSAMDTASPDAAWTRPRLRSRASRTAPANIRIDTIGSTRARWFRNRTHRCSLASWSDRKSTSGAPE